MSVALRELLRGVAESGSKEAEAALRQAQEQDPDALATGLLEVLSSADSKAEGQLCLVLLKRLLGEGGWARLTPATQATAQATLVHSLRTQPSLSAACLAIVGRAEFPESAHWLAQLVTAAADPKAEASLRSGALLCVEEMASSGSEEQLEPLGALVLPAFVPLFAHSHQFPGEDVLRAGRALNSLGNAVRMAGDVELPDRLLRPALSAYVPAWIALLHWEPDKVEVVRGALMPLASWTEAVSDAVAESFGPDLVAALARLFEAVSQENLRQLQEGGAEAVECGEERSGAAEVAYVGTDVLQTLVLSGDFELEGSLESLLGSLLRQSHASAATARRWMEEPEAFLEEEEAEGLGSSVRAATRDLLSDLLASDQGDGAAVDRRLEAFSTACLGHLGEASARLGAGEEDWWAYLEAALSLLALAAEHLRLLPPSKQAPLLEALSTLPGSIGKLKSSEPPYPLLRGQLLCLLARFAPELSEEGRSALLAELERCLDKAVPPIVRLCAVKAAKALADYVKDQALPESLLRPSLGNLLRALSALVGEGAGEQTYYLLLPALESLLRVSPSEGVAAEPKMRPLAMALTLKYSGDPLIPSQAGDILRLLARQEGCRESVVAGVVPTCLSVLRQPSAPNIPVHLPAVALATLTSVLKGCAGAPLPAVFLSEAFPLVASLAVSGGEQDVLAGCRECLRAFLAVAPEQTLQWTAPDGTSAVQALVQVVLHLLGPSAPELAGSYVNRLLYLLLQSALPQTRPHLDAILNAALQRAKDSQLASVRQTVLTIVSYAVKADVGTALAFLAQRPSPSAEPAAGPTALHFYAAELDDRLTHAVAGHDRKVCGLALSAVLEAGADGSQSSPALDVLRSGAEPLLLRLARLAVTEWRLQCPQGGGAGEEEDGKLGRSAGEAGGFSLQEALQSLAADLGELWSDSDDDDEDRDNSAQADPLASVESGAVLEETLRALLGDEAFAQRLLPTLSPNQRQALVDLAK